MMSVYVDLCYTIDCIGVHWFGRRISDVKKRKYAFKTPVPVKDLTGENG